MKFEGDVYIFTKPVHVELIKLTNRMLSLSSDALRKWRVPESPTELLEAHIGHAMI